MGTAHDKGRRFEQNIGKFLLEKDGECDTFAPMTSSTGRIGQQTNLQVDVMSDTFAVECKRRNSLPNWLQEAWNQIVERADDNDKIPLLAMRGDREDTMYVISEEQLEILIQALGDDDSE